MNLNSINAAAPDWPQTSDPYPTNTSQPSRELARAVQQLNRSSILPENREISLSLDPKTKTPVVRVLDATTHEVLEQLPSEYVLQVNAYLQSEAAQESLSKQPEAGR